MHEVHLMKQVVRAVEQALVANQERKPSVVRLKVSALSHLVSHDPSSLQMAFEMASQGTRVEGALLDIVTVPIQARCRTCGLTSNIELLMVSCGACGSTDMEVEEIPEVVVQEVVVTE